MSEPLLSSRPSSEHGDDNPEDGLLGGRRQRSGRQAHKGDWVKLGLGIWAGVATLAVVAVAFICMGQGNKSFPPKGKRNVVFMVSDGMGPVSLTMTRSYLQHVKGLPWSEMLTLDKNLIGTSRTRSTSSLVTDSAAGATAFSCGLKSYNGAISVLPDGSPCGTVLEAAKLAGYKTGLVVTTRLTDATPACFSAHVNMRSEEDRIAEQQLGDYPLGLMLDLALGGGRCFFLANTTEGSCRADDRDLVSEAQKKHGFKYVSDRAGFDSLKKGKDAKLPLLGLFAPTDIPYEIDRKDEEYPSLDEMAEAALNALEEATKDSEHGFFLMVEGSRIDHAGHGNDPAAQVHEVLAYDKAFARILKWVNEHDAILVGTSDHETGGLAIARQLHETYPEYLWYPQVLANATHSSDYLAARYREYEGSGAGSEEKFIRTALQDDFGILDASEAEIEILKAHKAGAGWAFADMISRRAQIGWSTHGHSGVDVNIYGSKGTERLHGNHENNEIGAFLADYLGLDLGKVTKILKEKGVGKINAEGKREYGWMGKPLAELKANATDRDHFHVEEIDNYHGEFKRHVGCDCH